MPAPEKGRSLRAVLPNDDRPDTRRCRARWPRQAPQVLIVIDIQQGSFAPASPRNSGDGVAAFNVF